MNQDPIVVLAVVLLISMALNILLALWAWSRGKGRGNVLMVWTGRGLIPLPVKPGQKRHIWTRPDKSRVAFNLFPDFSMGYGQRGMCWIGNGANGEVMRWDPIEKVFIADAATEGKPRTWRDWMPGAPKNDAEETKLPVADLMRVEVNPLPVFPDGNKMAAALDDAREDKWFNSQANVDKGKLGIKPIYLIIGAIVLVYFLQQKGMLHF